MLVMETEAVTNTGSFKDMLQGYLTGHLASALGSYQVEALRREFKRFTEHVDEALKMFKEKAEADIQKLKGIICPIIY